MILDFADGGVHKYRRIISFRRSRAGKVTRSGCYAATRAVTSRRGASATRPGGPLRAGFRSGLADQPDRLANAAVPGRPVPGQQPGGIEALDPVERRDSLLWLERERRRLGTRDAGENIAGGHRVPEEQRVDGRDVHRDTAGR